jgi:hypothetical protein
VPVTEVVDSRKLRCFGHLIRVDNNRKLRHIWERRVEGMWGRGRARIEWEQRLCTPEQIGSAMWLGLSFTCHTTAFSTLVTHPLQTTTLRIKSSEQ